MTANRTFGGETPKLFVVDQPVAKQLLGTLAPHRPSFAFGKGLLQEFEIGKRRHAADMARFQLFSNQGEVEARLEMMHSGLQKTLAMKCHPQPNRAEPWRR